MSKHILTVVFKPKNHGRGVTSQVYNLDSYKEAELLISNLENTIGMSYYIDSCIACVGEKHE